MGTLAAAVLAALNGFRSEVLTWVNQGSLITIDGHIGQIEAAVAQDVHAGETAAKQVLGELYGALHGHTPAPAEEPAPVEPTPPPATGGLITPDPAVAVGPGETVAPVAAGPTPATPASPTAAPASTSSSASSSAASASTPATSAPAPSA